MSDRRDNTELEGCVLGVFFLHGPCTSYTVRREFLHSPTPHWSGSAGAIYPLVARLEKQGLIRARPRPRGEGGRRREYEITEKGVTELRRWIGPPFPEWAVKPTFDPVRTRLLFFGALSPRARRKFIDQARATMRDQIEEMNERLLVSPDRFDRLTLIGCIFDLEARIRWLDEVEETLRKS